MRDQTPATSHLGNGVEPSDVDVTVRDPETSVVGSDGPETIVLTSPGSPTVDEESVRLNKKRRHRQRGVIVAAAVLVVLGGAYVGLSWFLGDRVPAGTTVAGVNISGLPETEAKTVLAEGLVAVEGEPIHLTFGDVATDLTPADAGLSVDVDKTVEGVTGFTLDPWVIWGHLFGAGATDPKVVVDEKALNMALIALSKDLNTDPVEGAISFKEGKPVVSEPQEGSGLDVDAAAELVSESWLMTSAEELELPQTVLKPTVDAAVIEKTMSDQIDPMMSGPVTVKINDATTKLMPKDLANAAYMKAKDDTLTLSLNGEKLAKAITKKMDSIGKTPRDARIELSDTGPKVIPAITGTGLDPKQLATTVKESALSTNEKQRVATLELKKAEPEFSTADANKLKVNEVIGRYSTPYPNDPVRTQNLTAGTAKINNTLVKPGEQFSLLNTLLPITAANGYTESGVVVNGFHSDAIGGGLSQVSTTTFNAAFEAGLKDITHQPHSRWFDRYPMGREATLFDPSIDMIFENNTGYGVLIQAYVTNSEVVVQMWGNDVFDVNISTSDTYNFTSPQTLYNSDPDCHAEPGGKDGFSVNVTRTVSKGDSVVEERTYSHTYSPWNTVICGEEPNQDSEEDED